MKTVVSLFLSLLISISVNAGISNIGNGGGLAEMRVIYLHQNLDRFLRICLTANNVCQLSNQTRSEWQNLVQRQVKDGSYYVISFVPTLSMQSGYKVEDTQLTIASQSLYIGLEIPKQFGELLAYVIAVRQDMAGSEQSFTQNLEIATSVFKALKVEESLSLAAGLPSLIRIAQVTAFDGQNKHFLFSIEDKDKTIDITALVGQALPCGQLSDWNFSQWNSSVARTGYFYGYANGLCNGQSMQKRIVIQFEVSSSYVIDASKVAIHFFTN